MLLPTQDLAIAVAMLGRTVLLLEVSLGERRDVQWRSGGSIHACVKVGRHTLRSQLTEVRWISRLVRKAISMPTRPHLCSSLVSQGVTVINVIANDGTMMVARWLGRPGKYQQLHYSFTRKIEQKKELRRVVIKPGALSYHML